MRPSQLRRAAKSPYSIESKKASKVFEGLKKTGVISEYKDSKNRRYTLATDTRTRCIDGVYHITPFYFGEKSWYIVCPYCNEIHSHSAGEGYRSPHCGGIDTPDYYLESREV